MKVRRREFLKTTAAALPALALAHGVRADATSPFPGRLLFVVAAAGGGSILESFLPVVDTEVGNTALANTLAVHGSAQVAQVGGHRCVVHRNRSVASLPVGEDFDQRTFLQHHGSDTAVMTCEVTSVNHLVAQKRALTGASINSGRTIMEAMAEVHGQGLPLPNCNMAQGGYLEGGDDVTLDPIARPEALADPLVFPLAMDGVRGVSGAPDRSLVERARKVRDTLEGKSAFGHTFASSTLRKQFLDRRTGFTPQVEAMDLITKLTLVKDDPGKYPLSDHGLSPGPDADFLQTVFPKLLSDPFEAQAALAFLLVKNGVSCAVTISPSFSPIIDGVAMANTPLAFDFSHNDHAGTQNLMWNRVLRIVDGLVTLLKGENAPDGNGTLWDRSLVFIATDFGREKVRPSGAQTFGTGHHLNNGAVLVSPLLNGDRVYGGVDPTTLLTFGFDRTTGVADPTTLMREGDVYSVIAQAMGVQFPGRLDAPCIVKS